MTNAVTTRYVVSNPAGTLVEAAGPHMAAMAVPSIAIVTIEYTNSFPLARCTFAPFDANKAESGQQPERAGNDVYR